jgi:H+/Cl- antiporter ClcA
MDQRSFRADERLNQFSDRDDMWGPLLFLRPEKRVPMSLLRVLMIAAVLGVFYGMLGNVVLALLAKTGSAGKPPIWMMPTILTGMYFVSAQLSIVGAWNRRARQTSRRLDWAELTRRPSPPPRDDQQEAE